MKFAKTPNKVLNDGIMRFYLNEAIEIEMDVRDKIISVSSNDSTCKFLER